MIVDAHAHVFDRIRGRIGCGPIEPLDHGRIRLGNGEIVPLLPPVATEICFTPEMLLEYMDQAGVDKAVLLQGAFYGDMNDYVAVAATRWPDRFIGAAYLDPWSDDPERGFHHVVEELGFSVVKLELSEATGLAGLHPDLRLDDPRLDWFWDDVRGRGIVVTLDMGPVGGKAYQTRAVANVLDARPGLKLVIAHLAQPPLAAPDDEGRNRLWEQQLRLGQYPSVWFDLASLANYAAQEDYPFPTARRYIQRAVQLIGADRLLWGTDAPGLLRTATYPQLLGFVADHCDFLTETERDGVLGENAALAYH